MLTYGKQIAAARQLLGWSQEDLVEHSGISKPSLVRMEKKLSDVGQDLRDKVFVTLCKHGIEFIDGGARNSHRIAQIMEGDDCYLRILNDAQNVLLETKGEFLRIGANETLSPLYIVEKQQIMRNAGVPFRCLLQNNDTFIRGPLDEYRWMDDSLYTESDVKVIYGDKIAYLIKWYGSYRAVIIEDKNIAEENRRLFEFVWKQSRIPTHSRCEERWDGAQD